jgi:ATP-dependent DNA helicase DinG
VNEQQIYEIFDQDGLLCNSLDSYEFREGQLKMALDVLHCYEKSCVGAIEAGTGIGKSFAYLVPAILHTLDARKQVLGKKSEEEEPKGKVSAEERTVIATSTVNLQRQLMDKDIPTLLNILGVDCSVAFAVGRGHYICLRRLASEVESNALFQDDLSSEIMMLNRYANDSDTGLREDFPGHVDGGVWNSICSDSDLCISGKCPFYNKCFYVKAKRKLMDSSIIVCNHHLLFVDSHARYMDEIEYKDDAVLPGFKHLVIDEAHNIERTATDLFTNSFSSYDLLRQLNYIQDRKSSRNAGYGHLLDDLLPFCTERKLYEEILSGYDLLKERCETMNLIFTDLLNNKKDVQLLLDDATAKAVFQQGGEVANQVVTSGEQLTAKLVDFYLKIKSTDEAVLTKADDLKVHISRIVDLISFFKDFLQCKDWNDGIHYLELQKVGKGKYVFFNRAPLEVATTLQEALFRPISSVVCTSATLNLNDDFAYWCSDIGLPVEGKEFVRRVYSSPFDYKNRLMLLTPYDTPIFSPQKDDEYVKFLIENTRSAISSSGGGALVLFTSFRHLEAVYNSVAPSLMALGITVYKQGDFERHVLLNKFKADIDSVLFATDSFWEGVDAPGDTLRLVIITKLPFIMPDDPIFKARSRVLEEKGINPFYTMSLPHATMKLKQGFGRLMRHTTDRGIVLILDARIIKKNYGPSMLRALPESYYPETDMASLGTKIESFLY